VEWKALQGVVEGTLLEELERRVLEQRTDAARSSVRLSLATSITHGYPPTRPPQALLTEAKILIDVHDKALLILVQ
jgi:hypothetical protein